MGAIKTSWHGSRITIWGATLCLLISATPAHAGGGSVLPPTAKAKDYSLAEAAAATAYFDTGPRTPDTLPKDFPFQILYVAPGDSSNTFSVEPGTMLYVPVVYSDDTDSALWPFPDVNDPEAVSNYYFDREQLGAEFIRVVVDGNLTLLGPTYAVGAETPGLPTGGNNFTVAAAFLTPLSKGTHTVTIAARFSGAFIAMYPQYFPGGIYEFEITYTVIVR
jgi:hypothetical protein